MGSMKTKSVTTSDEPIRFVPNREFPAYSYVPGKFPHPISDPAGHSFGKEHPTPAPLDPDNWQSCEDYLYGLDLFNHGFYWEAHETWEGLWIACGRTGVTAEFLKGLIKLAAAGVKACEGNSAGVQRHANRAAELFEFVDSPQGLGNPRFMGLEISGLIRVSHALKSRSRLLVGPLEQASAVSFCQFVLTPALDCRVRRTK